jgi:hypothetical protein
MASFVLFLMLLLVMVVAKGEPTGKDVSFLVLLEKIPMGEG